MELRVVFYRNSKEIQHRLISYWTGSIYTHVEIILPSGERVGIRPLYSGVSKWFEEGSVYHWEEMYLEVSEEQIKMVCSFYEETKGDPYDWLGVILVNVFWVPSNRIRRWFCSRWVARALSQANIIEIPAKFELNPGSLHTFLEKAMEIKTKPNTPKNTQSDLSCFEDKEAN